MIVFLLFEAGTFGEYADSFYIFATASLKACMFSVMLCKRAKLLKLMDDYENTINNRKYFYLNSMKIMRNGSKIAADGKNYHIKTEKNKIFRNSSPVSKI